MMMQETQRKSESVTLQWWTALQYKMNSGRKLEKARARYIKKCLEGKDKPTEGQVMNDAIEGLNITFGRDKHGISPLMVIGEEDFLLQYTEDSIAALDQFNFSATKDEPDAQERKFEHLHYRLRSIDNWDDESVDGDRYPLHKRISHLMAEFEPRIMTRESTEENNLTRSRWEAHPTPAPLEAPSRDLQLSRVECRRIGMMRDRIISNMMKDGHSAQDANETAITQMETYKVELLAQKSLKEERKRLRKETMAKNDLMGMQDVDEWIRSDEPEEARGKTKPTTQRSPMLSDTNEFPPLPRKAPGTTSGNSSEDDSIWKKVDHNW